MPCRLRRFSGSGLAAVVASAAMLAACTGGDAASPPTTQLATTTTIVSPPDGQLRVALVAPLTGPGASLGEPIRDALMAQVEVINDAGGVNGSPVELVVQDEAVARPLDQALASDVDAIVGPMSSNVVLAQLRSAVGGPERIVTCSPSATAALIDEFPDSLYFFRTVPSDSAQMSAIIQQVQRTGESEISVAYLDDEYGRELLEQLTQVVDETPRISITTSTGFSGDTEDLQPIAAELLADDPQVVVVLADTDDGGRFLTALDAAGNGQFPNAVIANDALRGARQSIQSVSAELREALSVIAPFARPTVEGEPLPAFVAQAIDCLNLIALAAVRAGSDATADIRRNMAIVSIDGRPCTTFQDCQARLSQNLLIDYRGLSGEVDLAVSGDLRGGRFDVITFDDDGTESISNSIGL